MIVEYLFSFVIICICSRILLDVLKIYSFLILLGSVFDRDRSIERERERERERSWRKVDCH